MRGPKHVLDVRVTDDSWRYEIGAWVKSSPAVSGNSVVVGAYDGNLYCFVGDGSS